MFRNNHGREYNIFRRASFRPTRNRLLSLKKHTIGKSFPERPSRPGRFLNIQTASTPPSPPIPVRRRYFRRRLGSRRPAVPTSSVVSNILYRARARASHGDGTKVIKYRSERTRNTSARARSVCGEHGENDRFVVVNAL